MMHRSRWLLVLAILGMLLAGCGESTSKGDATGTVTTIPPTQTTANIGSLPATPAPNRLGEARLPADAPGIAALLARLPSTVAGQPRTPQRDQAGPDRYAVTYGEGRDGGRQYTIQAANISTGGLFPPGWTAGDVAVFRAAQIGQPQDTIVVAVGREGGLVWMQDRSAATGTTPALFATGWGTASSVWFFGAQADTPEAVEALVSAFVAAAKGA